MKKELEEAYQDINWNNVRCEYGSVDNVRFLKPEQVKMYDGKGNIVLCACGKPATNAAMGKEVFSAWCSECSPYSMTEAELVYRKSDCSNARDKIISDEWILDIK